MGEIIQFRPKHTNPTGEDRKAYIKDACYDAYFELSSLRGITSLTWGEFIDIVREKCMKLGFTEFTIQDEVLAVAYSQKNFAADPGDDGAPDITPK